MVKLQGSTRSLCHRIAWKLMTGAAIIALTAGCARLGKKDKPHQRVAAMDYSKGERPQLKSNNPLYLATAHWAEQHRKKPADPRAALSYSRNLKALGSKDKAIRVLASTYQLNPGHAELASDYGRLALDLGRPQIAEPLLNQAMKSKRYADWRVLSALGTVNAKRGDHQKAQSYYMAALKKKPDSTSVYINLALSYALDGNAGEAEKVLKKAASKGLDSARIRQNLALVLELQNKNSEAKMVAQAGHTGKRIEHNKNNLRSREKPVKLVSSPQKTPNSKTGRTRAKTGIRTTASLPNGKPAAKVKTANRTRQPKPVSRNQKSSIHTASLTAKPPQTAPTRIAPKAGINRTVRTTQHDAQQIKSKILRTEQEFSFPAGN